MSDTQPEPQNKAWNYHPDLPLKDPSIFNWPPNPAFLAGWFARNWLMLSERVMMLILATALYLWAYPSLDTTQTWAFG